MYLRTYLLTSQEFDFIAFRFNPNGKVYCVPGENYTNAEDISLNTDLFDLSKNGKSEPVWYIDHQNGKLNGIYLKRSITGRFTNKEIGTIVFKIREDFLFGILKSYLNHKVQNVCVMSDNIRLYYYNSIDTGFEDEASNLLKASVPGRIKSLSYKEDTIYLFYNTISPLEWKLSVYISSNTLLADLRKILFRIVILCFLTLPIWLLLIDFIYRGIIKPINILVESMGKIEKAKQELP
jgi:two-component system sensor histidine kinase YesM